MTRNAFITGSGGGLGVAVVGRFLTAGWNVTAPRRAEVDLNDPAVVLALRRTAGQDECRVFARAKLSTEDGFDVFRIEASTSPTTGYQQVFAYSGSGQGFIESLLPATFNGQSSVYVRLRMSSDSSEQDVARFRRRRRRGGVGRAAWRARARWPRSGPGACRRR